MLHQAMEVLRLYSPARPELGVVEAAELLGKSKSTVSRWLRQMSDAGFLVRDAETGRYRPSMELAALGELARRSTNLQRAARPVLNNLVEEEKETANLVILSGDQGVNVEGVQSPRSVQHMGVLGRRLPLHATAAGKVLLSGMGPQDREACLGRPLEAYTPRTVTDPDLLRAELEEVWERGYAVAWRELEEDMAAVSAPVHDHRGEVVAAVTVSVPTGRWKRARMEVLGQAVAAAATRLSVELGWRGPPAQSSSDSTGPGS